MRWRWMWVAVAAVTGCQKEPGAAPLAAAPQSEEQKTFYALGASVGRNLSVFALKEEDLATVQLGLRDQVLGKPLQVDFDLYAPKVQALARTRGRVRADGEKEKGAGFLELAAKEPGAVKTESGLVFRSMTEGAGAAPAASDTVQVQYRGTTIDGTVFDSSSAPATFPLTGVIRCWTEGVQKMKVGGKAKLVCPPQLAYGDRGSPPKIPGGATLVFEIELLGITGK